MSKSFYPKMAVSNINKNRKTYYPYIITCILTIMMFFMMNSILHNSNVKLMKNGDNIIMLLNIGMWVTGIFAVMFLFYTNSFLIKRRQKEIGLYNILGMEKRHIAKMMFFETLFTAVISIAGGIISGAIFGKLIFLLLFKLLGSDQIPKFQVPLGAVINTLLIFLGVFVVILIYNLIRIKITKPIELVHGGQVGEKEPKTKILLTIIGVLTMGAGYAFALFSKSPLQAMNFFLIAVILVIVGTYCLFVAGSIAIIKLLRKNKKFYYQPKHFMNISGMLYRMKQNAVGLANICILSTMVLVSVSTTVSMYIGMDDTLKKAYPKEICTSMISRGCEDLKENDELINELLKKYNATVSDCESFESVNLRAVAIDGKNKFEIMKSGITSEDVGDYWTCFKIISQDDFNKMEGSSYQLNPGEVVVYNNKGYDEKNIELQIAGHNDKYTVKSVINKINKAHLGIDSIEQYITCYVLIVDSQETFKSYVEAAVQNETVDNMEDIEYQYTKNFNTNISKENVNKLNDEINALQATDGKRYIYSENQYAMKEESHQIYGGFLFIGMFVGSLFLMATVLIIYYKQISEGYEDKNRFDIMQKVGMSRKEVKSTIRSQVLMVFFIPLIMAAIHVAVSFRIIKMILSMLNLGNVSLFIWCTIGTVFIFAVIYAIVFVITERAYVKIVNRNM